MSNYQAWRWVFTVNQQDGLIINEDSAKTLKQLLSRHCKKWCFQLEKGSENERFHFQGRASLKIKKRKNELIQLILPEWNIWWQPEGPDEKASEFYVCKEQTRILGPWSDQDETVYVPKQLEGISLRGWQSSLRSDITQFDTRRIHFIIDENGGIGKSTFCLYMQVFHKAIRIPSTIDKPDDIMQYVCSILVQRKQRKDVYLMLDIPRATKDKQWHKWLTCIEDIKNGALYDHRYRATQWFIDSPGIAVFANSLPDRSLLSADRWTINRPSRYDREVIVLTE